MDTMDEPWMGHGWVMDEPWMCDALFALSIFKGP